MPPLTGTPQHVTPEDLARFVVASASYGHWNATPKRTGGGQARICAIAEDGLDGLTGWRNRC